jgi:hypothetical protein
MKRKKNKKRQISQRGFPFLPLSYPTLTLILTLICHIKGMKIRSCQRGRDLKQPKTLKNFHSYQKFIFTLINPNFEISSINLHQILPEAEKYLRRTQI